MTRSEIDAILAGTKGVTSGPWVRRHDDEVWASGQKGRFIATGYDESAAAHIARLDPQTVSALCTALLESMDRVEELERVIEPFAATAEKDIGESEADDDIFQNLTHHYAPQITVGHFRAARKSLGGSNER